jgi:nucleoside-triphosphatase
VKILLEGRPGSGKTTVVARLADRLRNAGVTVGGFVTHEVREQGRRVGFEIETLDGRRATLAHTSFRGPPRVGKYGVDVEAFEHFALPALAGLRPGAVVLIDELGKMELASIAFRDAVADLVERDTPVVAAVHAFRHPFTDALKARPDAEVIHLTRKNRDELPRLLAEKFAPGDNEQRAS